MPLATGTRLGPYEILAPLGAGGMGEVYRAHDPRLQREVAIKVLPSATAASPEALARFQREARAIAALAHPNLLALYDVGSESGFAYAVTELLEGSALRDRLASGPMSVSEAASLALQMARGLAAAHEKGIVHRDLKPENVFVTRDGHLKILDFGLAKRVVLPQADSSGDGDTVTSVTVPGAVMGTLGYMPPEQLSGEPVDQRADVFAFGAVLYEMLTGERAFRGASAAALMGAILVGDPPALSAMGRGGAAAFEPIVRRCLAKTPAARYGDGREVLDALQPAAASLASGAPPAPREPGQRRRSAPMGLALPAAALVIALVAAFGFGIPQRFFARSRHVHSPIRPHAIAMLEFENLTGDHSLDWVARGLPELLGTALARSQELDVYDPQRLANLLSGSGSTRDTAAPVFERLKDRGVGRAIVGSLLRSGPELRIQCRIVDVESGKVLHADASQGTASGDIFQIAGGLIPKLQTWLEIDLSGAAQGDRWLREITTSSSDAYRLYLLGHAAMIESRWRESAGYDLQSLALDSNFVAARVDLSGCYWNLGDEARTRESLAAARRLHDRASPREALQLEMIEAVISGDAERLIRVASSLRALYPENRFFTYLLGRGYYTAGRWASCLEVLEPLVRERWSWGWTYVLSSRSLEKLGRVQEARRDLETGMAVTHANPEVSFVYATFLAAHGDSSAARRVLLETSRSPALAETPEFEARVRVQLGALYEAEGRPDSACTEYQRAGAVMPAGDDEAGAATEGLRRTSRGR